MAAHVALRFVHGPQGSFKRLAAFGVAGGCAIVGSAIGVRQYTLSSCPIVEATSAQLRSADAVTAFLGSAVASTDGIVGGYLDPVKGTAVVTLPIVSENGVRAEARAEAEAEWVVRHTEAVARGEVPPEPVRSLACRWLIRHLEVTLEAAESEAPEAASNNVLTLYSLPRNVPLSPWAPNREPSRFPRWLRALFPNPNAVSDSEAMPRMVAVGAAVLLMHSLGFMVIRKRMIAERAIKRAEKTLKLSPTPTLITLRNAAIETASKAPNSDGVTTPVKLEQDAVCYGHTNPNFTHPISPHPFTHILRFHR